MNALWLPFTANKFFKQNHAQRVFTKAKGMHYWNKEGRQILDMTAGLWCVNAGHARSHIVQALHKQAQELDFAPTFQFAHDKAFEFAERASKELLPASYGLNKVFFTNCGSTAVDSALKIALHYQIARGAATKYRLIGRERGYHGVGFGGTAVGGIVSNRRSFGPTLVGVDHIRSTHDLSSQAFSRKQPQQGAHFAEDLERLVSLHDASTIAAVIIEPVAGSTGVLVPPLGYLKRVREICDKHDILLIFDEVITGVGRLGKGFAAEYFGVVPDLITCAKGLTNAAVPCGAVFIKQHIYDTVVNANTSSSGGAAGIELAHGYTYSGHPLAMAAGMATLDIIKEDGLFERAAAIEQYWEDALHSLKGIPGVQDIRNIGFMGAVELTGYPGRPGERGFEVLLRVLERGVFTRLTGDTLAFSPPLIASRGDVDELVGALRGALTA
jgi:beta-alanine--pyruvate transaminase